MQKSGSTVFFHPASKSIPPIREAPSTPWRMGGEKLSPQPEVIAPAHNVGQVRLGHPGPLLVHTLR
jgi:hypothetical protein